MSSYNTKQGEALYIIILRDPRANEILKTWATQNKQEVHLANNKMSLYSQNSFDLFQVTWTGTWHNLTIWDSWNRRHIYLD
jgi:hypothetical protein